MAKLSAGDVLLSKPSIIFSASQRIETNIDRFSGNIKGNQIYLRKGAKLERLQNKLLTLANYLKLEIFSLNVPFCIICMNNALESSV